MDPLNALSTVEVEHVDALQNIFARWALNLAASKVGAGGKNLSHVKLECFGLTRPDADSGANQLACAGRGHGLDQLFRYKVLPV